MTLSILSEKGPTNASPRNVTFSDILRARGRPVYPISAYRYKYKLYTSLCIYDCNEIYRPSLR